MKPQAASRDLPRAASLRTLAAVLVTGLAAIAAATPAHAAWMWDTNANKLDDRIEQVESLGPLAARVGQLATGKLRFALMNEAAPYRYGVYVGFDHHPTDADAAALAATGAPVQVRYRSIDYVRSEVTLAQAVAIAALPGVTRIETIPILYATNDNATRILRARPSSAAFPSVWKDLGITGRGVVVGILDTGVNDEPDNAYPGHESLRGKFVGGGSFFSGQPELNTPLDASENPKHAVDPEVTYHGTHVAGTAIGSGGPVGVLSGAEPGPFAGVAPEARLVDLKVLSDAGLGFGAADALDWVVAHRFDDWGLTGDDAIYRGIQVLNLSLGGTDNSDGTDASCAAVNAAHKAGVVVCVATGNDGNTGYMASPSAADLALSVGAFTDNNTLSRADDLVADYSNEGPRLSDNDSDQLDEMKPSVLGSGTGILSALGDPATDGRQYHHINGTSMATPTIAGLCALLLQANPTLSPDQVQLILENTADHRTDAGKQDPSAADPFGVDPNYHPSWGWGEPDAYAAALEAMNDATTQVVRVSATPQRGPDAVRIDWTSQREIDLVRYVIQRAPDVLGVPGTWTDVALIPVTEQHPEILRQPNRHPYSWVDSGPGLDPDATYWYRVRWLDFHNRTHSEPPLSARITSSPVTARVRFSWTHNYSDGDLVVRFGSGTSTASPVWQRFAPGAPAADSMVTEPGVNYTGTKHYFFHVDLTAADLVQGFLPPSAANPWFLSVKEGGFINTKGTVNSFAIDVFNGAVTTTYTALNPPTSTIEKQETVFWIPLDPVTTLNHAPVFLPVGDVAGAEGIPMGFQVTALDADGQALAYAATGLPAGATFNLGTRRFDWTPSHTQAGAWDVTFRASDGQFPTPAADTQVVHVVVADRAPGSNLPPVLEPLNDRQALTGELLSLRVMARDPEHGLVTFTSSLTLPANSSLDPATGLFSWTPSLDQVGTTALHFVATDAGGLSDDGEMLVTVSQAGVGPAPALPCDETAAHTNGIVGMGTDPGEKSVSYVGFDVPANVQRIEGQLSFALAPVRDLDFYLLDADSNAVTSSASINQPESIVYNTPSPGHYIWKVVAFTNPDTANFAIDQQVCVASTAGAGDKVTALRLAPAAPNPFRSRTMLRWSLPEAGMVRLRVHDVAGRAIRTLQNGRLPAGEHSVTWDQRDDGGHRVAPGLYFVRFEAAGHALGQKVILLP
jgi:subtilisin family serine protease